MWVIQRQIFELNFHTQCYWHFRDNYFVCIFCNITTSQSPHFHQDPFRICLICLIRNKFFEGQIKIFLTMQKGYIDINSIRVNNMYISMIVWRFRQLIYSYEVSFLNMLVKLALLSRKISLWIMTLENCISHSKQYPNFNYCFNFEPP